MAVQKNNEKNIAGTSTRLWHKYKSFVENATRGSAGIGIEDITYWRDKLFTSFITYLMPVCLIALVPGVFMGIKSGYLFIAAFDIFVVVSIAAVSLSSRLNLVFRKAFVVFMLYCLAAALLVYLGLMGPGLIYLLAMSVFITLTLKRNYAYYSVAANFLICVFCAAIIELRLFNSPLSNEYDLGTWIAVSSNLVFLSWVSVVLISNTINSLEDIIIKEFRLKNELKKSAVEAIRRNAQLKESESHYKNLFSLSPSPMWLLDGENMRFLQVNDAAVEKYGYTNEEFLTMNIRDIKLEEDMAGFFEILQENHKVGTPLVKINQHRKKNGELFFVEVRFNSVPFRGKQATLGIARDMTEQMNYIKAIEGQNEKLHEIAYIQSHFVRAPLVRIMGLIDLMTKDVNEKKDPEILAYLDQSAKELDEVIQTITSKTAQI